MKRYKLIKEYPGSPILGVMHSDENKLGEWKGHNYYEKYPEHWEEIEDTYYMVLTKYDMTTSFRDWVAYKMIKWTLEEDKNRQFFKNREEADEFILYNKPCLSYNDVKEEIKSQVSQQEILQSIYNIVKSRI